MATHIRDLKKIRIPTAFRILLALKEAKNNGLSAEESLQWAHFRVEAARQAGRFRSFEYSPSRSAWRKYDPDTIIRLMEDSGFERLKFDTPLESILTHPGMELEHRGFINMITIQGYGPHTNPDDFSKELWYIGLCDRYLAMFRYWSIGHWGNFMNPPQSWIPYDMKQLIAPWSQLFFGDHNRRSKLLEFITESREDLTNPIKVRQALVRISNKS